MTDDLSTRQIAFDILKRIDSSGAFANLVLGPALERTKLDTRDRAFVTELVYGTTRMRRACDHAVERFLHDEIQPDVRTLLRLGAYQILYLRVPAHAAVSETVAVAPNKVRGLINAVLRRVAENPVEWPDPATRLSVPEWIRNIVARDHGADDADAALEAMNTAPKVVERDDGYVQDTASQWVVNEVEAGPETRTLDLCAAPGGKATALAATGAPVVAGDRRASRVRLVEANSERLGSATLASAVADALAPPFRPQSFDRVLLDAPCSGLGVLRRRADARWRIEPEAPERLAELQRAMVAEALQLVAPGGLFIYSVCTLTAEETTGVVPDAPAGFEPAGLAHPERWRPWGLGGIVLPHDHDTDGMAVIRLRRV